MCFYWSHFELDIYAQNIMFCREHYLFGFFLLFNIILIVLRRLLDVWCQCKLVSSLEKMGACFFQSTDIFVTFLPSKLLSGYSVSSVTCCNTCTQINMLRANLQVQTNHVVLLGIDFELDGIKYGNTGCWVTLTGK